MGTDESPEIAYEHDIESCQGNCDESDEECPESGDCRDCFCPFKDKQCLADPCSLNLCQGSSQCVSSATSYQCQCNDNANQLEDRYCTPKPAEVCPSHWWGRPVCGPCNCNVSQGFNESCAIDTGKCRCKANHFVRNGQCQPCDCYNYGSLSPQCDTATGACQCRPGVSGQKCDKCSHGFAELTSSGCQVIYGVCPAEFSPEGIWWPRSVFGEFPNATCPENSVGVAKRPCTNMGWQKSDLSGCIHQEFIILSNQVKNAADFESWILVKRARETIENAKYLPTEYFEKDVAAIQNCVFKVLSAEDKAQGFELAHKKDRDFLENFMFVVSWLFQRGLHNDTLSIEDISLISAIGVYGLGLSRSMVSTFTNPLEVVANDVIFGLDVIKHRQRRDLVALASASPAAAKARAQITKIPKYNNYMPQEDSWSKIQAQVSTTDSTRLHYSIFRGNKDKVGREILLVPKLLWDTQVTLFSDIFSLAMGNSEHLSTVNRGIVEDVDNGENNMVKSVVFKNKLETSTNRVHCVLWDRDLWNAIDCVTQVETSLDSLSVNCSCKSPVRSQIAIMAVLEESIPGVYDYLTSKTDNIVFSICSSVSLAVLLLATGCLIMLNIRRKTSVRIHRNIVISVLCTQLLVLVVVLANTQLISMPFMCTFVTMGLHYCSVATFVWIAVESIHIYRMLSELRDINHGKTTFYSAFGFGIPGLVVGLTMGVSGTNYGSAAFCWFNYNQSSIWGMVGPEVLCAIIHVSTMVLNLRTVFRVKTDLEDFATLRLVFFVNACLLPLMAGFHITALLMINDRSDEAIYTYAAIAVILALYLLAGFVLCDKTMMRALAQKTGQAKHASRSGRQAEPAAGTNVAMATHQISRSSLSYGHRGKALNNLDVGAEVSVASTTSQSTYQTSSKFKSSHHTMHLDEPDIRDRYYHSDSETDIDRRSLDLASSINSSDEDMYDHDPSDLKHLKHLSVNDYPQY